VDSALDRRLGDLSLPLHQQVIDLNLDRLPVLIEGGGSGDLDATLAGTGLRKLEFEQYLTLDMQPGRIALASPSLAGGRDILIGIRQLTMS
jgi:hypothetical protein